MACLERGFITPRVLSLQPGHDHDSRSNQVAVGKSVPHVVLSGVGKVMLAAFLRPGVTDLVAQLNLHRQAVVQGL